MQNDTPAQAKACNRCGETKSIADYYSRSAACKPCVRQRAMANYEANREDRMRAMRGRWAANSEAHSVQRRAAYAASREQIREARRIAEQDPEYRARAAERSRRWYAENTERAQEVGRAYYLAHPGLSAAASRRRRARMRAAVVESYTRAQVWAKTDGSCGICGRPIQLEGWHVDHIVPLARGGNDTLDNVQASHPRCNRMKSDRLESELGERGRYA